MLGCRVVRGPDWQWGNQDGGEGGVGTIVDLKKFADGRPLPPNIVMVCWDNGRQADYRTGMNGCYDLRVFDSSSAGVEFKLFTCNGCMHSGITGIRWHCTECDDYDLCNVCYLNGVDDKSHAYERFHVSNDRTNGTIVGKRSDAENAKIRSNGIFPGADVKQGRDWTLDNELGAKVGRVVGLTAWENVARSAVLVNWRTGDEKKHRVGHEGKMDLCVVKAANGPWYYKDHLPVVSTINLPKAAYTGGNQLRVGDRVKTELDVETLKQLAEGHGGWVDGMQRVIGKVGKVIRIDEDGDVHVKYEIVKWVFHPEALCKVSTGLRTGDKVRVASNKEKVMDLQEGHGGWNNSMENILGKSGKVIRVFDGDMVVNIEGRVLVFNPDALILESKEEERMPAEEEDPSASAATGFELLLHAMLEGVSNSSGSGTGSPELLQVATTIGDLDKVKEIIGNNKALVNQKFSCKKTPLQVACHQGKPEIVSYLLENGADKETRDEKGYTALHHAAYGDETGVCVVIMLSANAKVNPTDLDRTKVTPLHLAVQRGNEAGVAALVQSKHLDVNCQDVVGDTPLHEAILRSQNSIFTYLIKVQNLDPTICNANGFNILHLACLKNCQHAAKLLIEKFPGLVDISKEDGFSALHVASTNNHHEISRLLLLSGHCSINMRNHEGMTALALSVSSSHKEMIELLIEHGADANLEDKDGDTPLHVAVMKHCIAYIGVDLPSLGLDRPAGNDAEKAIALFLVIHGRGKTDHMNHQGKTPLDLCIDEELKGRLRRHDTVQRNKQQGRTEAILTSPPRPSCDRVPSPRTVSPQPTPSSVPANPNLPSPPPAGTPVPSPRTVSPQPTPSSVPANPNLPLPPPAGTPVPSPRTVSLQPTPSSVPANPNLPSPPPAGTRVPSPRTVSPQPTPSSVPANPNLPSPPSAGTQGPSPRTVGPQPTPSVPENRNLSPPSPISPTDSLKPFPQPFPKPSPTKSYMVPPDAFERDPSSPASMFKFPEVVLPGETAVYSRPIDTSAMATVSGPASPSAAEAAPPTDLPLALGNLNIEDGRPCNSDFEGASAAESERRNPNRVIASEIKTSSDGKAKMVQSQRSNVQDELCQFCKEEKADVVVKPCNHKVFCQGCSVKAKVCIQCHQKITSKIDPGTGVPCLTLTEIKRAYEERIDRLERVANCQICMEDDRPSNMVFRPCGHKCCEQCARRLYICHICKIVIEDRIVSYQ